MQTDAIIPRVINPLLRTLFWRLSSFFENIKKRPGEKKFSVPDSFSKFSKTILGALLGQLFVFWEFFFSKNKKRAQQRPKWFFWKFKKINPWKSCSRKTLFSKELFWAQNARRSAIQRKIFFRLFTDTIFFWMKAKIPLIIFPEKNWPKCASPKMLTQELISEIRTKNEIINLRPSCFFKVNQDKFKIDNRKVVLK